MKIQTSAEVTSLKCGEQVVDLGQNQKIDLEFSAIDSGGGFKDPILDFSFTIDEVSFGNKKKKSAMGLTLRNPQADDEISFSCKADIDYQAKQINGRLKEEELSRELIGFVLQLLR
jgi:hypothetical protein